MPERAQACVHRWRIESPRPGPSEEPLRGRCQRCGARRDFARTIPEPAPGRRALQLYRARGAKASKAAAAARNGKRKAGGAR